MPSPVTHANKGGTIEAKRALHVLTSFTTVKCLFCTVLLPNGVLHAASPAFNCTLAQWVAGLGDARIDCVGTHLVQRGPDPEEATLGSSQPEATINAEIESHFG